MIKKQTKLLIVCGVVFAVLLAALLIVRPYLTNEADPVELIPLLPGEVRDEISGRVRLFPKVSESMIHSLEVHNEHGSYTFALNDAGNMVIKGMETAPYSEAAWAQLAAAAGSTLAITRLDEEDRSEDLSVYGFGEDAYWYEITVVDGSKHKVWIGKEILTGGGYYAMYEGRDAVYVLSPNFGTLLLANVLDFIVPHLAYPIPQAGYGKDSNGKILTVDDLKILKNGMVYIWIDALTADETGREDGLSIYELKHPVGYELNDSARTNLYQFLAGTESNNYGGFQGTKTVAAGLETDLDSETLKAYLLETFGIDLTSPAYMITYTFSEIPSAVFFSKPDEKGNMYAYSLLYGLVAEINISAASFFGWDLLTYVEPAVYHESIFDISKLEIKGEITGEGLTVDAFFTVGGSDVDTLTVKPNGSAFAYDKDNRENFQNLYMVLGGLRLQGNSDVTDKDPDRLTWMATVTATTDDGETLEYKFYYYNTRRCFYTVNGKGQFYVYRDHVEKLLRDTDRVVKGLPVDWQGKN